MTGVMELRLINEGSAPHFAISFHLGATVGFEIYNFRLIVHVPGEREIWLNNRPICFILLALLSEIRSAPFGSNPVAGQWNPTDT
jgi:hypothetical protein